MTLIKIILLCVAFYFAYVIGFIRGWKRAAKSTNVIYGKDAKRFHDNMNKTEKTIINEQH
jgi:hypothetical protein